MKFLYDPLYTVFVTHVHILLAFIHFNVSGALGSNSVKNEPKQVTSARAQVTRVDNVGIAPEKFPTIL